jgi:hypothetical protein
MGITIDRSQKAFKSVPRDATLKFRAHENFTAIAWARARDGTEWRLVLSFNDRDGRAHQLIVKRSEIIRSDALFELLDDFGFPIPSDHRARAMLRQSIIDADPQARLWIGRNGKLELDPAGHAMVQAAVTKIIDRLPGLAKHALDATKRRRSIDSKALAAASALRVRHSDGRRLLAIRPDRFRDLIGAAVSEKAVAAALEKQGVLVSQANGRRTRELRLPGINARRVFYCLCLPKATE